MGLASFNVNLSMKHSYVGYTLFKRISLQSKKMATSIFSFCSDEIHKIEKFFSDFGFSGTSSLKSLAFCI